MNKEQIEQLWKKATNNPNHDTNWYDAQVIEFAELVASAERERFCALLRQWHDTYSLLSDPSTIREKYKYGTPLLDAFTKDRP